MTAKITHRSARGAEGENMMKKTIVRQMLGSRKGKSVGGRSAFLSRTLDRSSPIYKALTNDLYGPWEPPATRQDRLCRESALCTPSHVANRACACRRSIPVAAQGVCTVRGIPSRHQCLADNSKLLTLGSSAGTEGNLALLQCRY